MPVVPESEILARVTALKKSLRDRDPPLDAAVVLQHVDLYYLAGTIQSAHLVVPREGEPALLVRKVLERAREDSPIRDIRPFTSLRALPEELERLLGKPPWRLGFELDVLPAATAQHYGRVLEGRGEIADVSRDVLALRSVKSAWELDQIRDAAQINERLYNDIGELLSEELSTYELQAILDCRARLAGHVGLVRMRGFNVDGLIGVVVSGPGGASPGHSQFPIGGLGPHPYIAYGGDLDRIRPDTPIIFDYLANRSGYHHDQTRMAVSGKFPREAERIYEGMRELLREVERRLAPGAIPARIYEEIVELARERGFQEGFMGPPGYEAPFIGHAIGLEVNEMPVLARKFDAPLVPGNVLAVEPKLTHADFGVVGIENTYAITAEGCERIGDTSEEVVVK